MGLLNSISKTIFGNKGAKKERQKVNAMMDANIGVYNNALADTTASYKPYTDLGTYSANALANPGTYFSNSPDYNFRRTEGMRDIGGSFAARGGAFSGNALKALNEFNSNLASGEYGNWWDRTFRGAALGSQATGQVADARGWNADSVAQANAIKGGMSAQEAATKYANYSGLTSDIISTLKRKYGI